MICCHVHSTRSARASPPPPDFRFRNAPLPSSDLRDASAPKPQSRDFQVRATNNRAVARPQSLFQDGKSSNRQLRKETAARENGKERNPIFRAFKWQHFLLRSQSSAVSSLFPARRRNRKFARLDFSPGK